MVNFPDCITRSFECVHPDFLPIINEGLLAMHKKSPNYFSELAQTPFLPTKNRLFAAFTQAPKKINYILVGEGPYPRENSATGRAFMDGAVGRLWSQEGLSKTVNRATSLRNFMKLLLVARGELVAGQTKMSDLKPIAEKANSPQSPYIETIDELEQHLIDRGFLLLNAALVYRSHVSAAKESAAWQPFMQTILHALAREHFNDRKRVLILWGKMAQKCLELPFVEAFECAVSEHPYNISFISDETMRDLFAPLDLLSSQ